MVTVETDPASATIAVDGHVVHLSGDGDGHDRGAWRPLRAATLGRSQVLIDDVDPYRQCFERAASDPLAPADLDHWFAALRDADEALSSHLAHHEPPISRGLTTITPLNPATTHASATHRHAFGAVGIAATAAPHDLPDALTLALVHEIQHLKMGAVLDLFELFDRTDRRRYAVGWRADLRPVEGVLQGAYAHLAVVDVWRRRRDHREGPAADQAAAACIALHDQTLAAIDTLLTSGALSALGRRWVEGMRAGACATSS